MNIRKKLYRIMTPDEWDEMQVLGEFCPSEFKREGQVYACYLYQTEFVSGYLYNSILGLVLVELDASKLGCEVIEKNLKGGKELFPHIQGAIPAEACLVRYQLPVEGDGSFELPLELRDEYQSQLRELEKAS
jgi:uncharacterized protein (DUF952 family)